MDTIDKAFVVFLFGVGVFLTVLAFGLLLPLSIQVWLSTP